MGKHISHIKSNLTVDSYINKETGAVVGADFYKLLPSDEQSKFELTTSPKLPTSEQLADGEIAINYAADYETISLKNNLSDIVTFKPDTYNSEKYATNAYVRENLGEIIINKGDLTAIAEAEGDNGVLTKTTNGDTATWSYTDQLYAQGTAQDLNAGTDTAEKVWDAKTIADYVQGTVNTLPEPMVFKGTLGTGGTISSLPEASSSNEGFTYKVITDGTYAGQKAKIGDLFISNGTAWNLVPSGDEPSGTVTNVATGTGLTGGPITTSGTISHADTSSQASVSNSGRTYIQSVTLDGMGHVTGLSSATEMVVNTDRYVNNAAFADDSTSTPASPVKMTLTRAGSDTATVTANLPKVSSTSAGVAPKGAAVTAQSQSTKFLREDGTWAAPSYTKPGGDVTGPSSSTDAHVAVFNGATGKVIKDSGYTIGKSVPSDAVFTDTTYSSKSEASGGTDVSLVTTGEKYTWNNKQNKVGKLGSATKPVYISEDGTFTECSTYAGGTAVTLNESSLAGSTASFYAPTYSGEAGQFLMSTGNSIYPYWTFLDKPYLPRDTVYSTLGTATSVTNVPITNRVVVVTISSGSAGSFGLASTLTKGRDVHVIVKNTGSSDYTITIPHSPSATSGYKYVNIVDNAQGNVIVPRNSGGYVEINALYDGTYVYLRYA